MGGGLRGSCATVGRDVGCFYESGADDCPGCFPGFRVRPASRRPGGCPASLCRARATKATAPSEAARATKASQASGISHPAPPLLRLSNALANTLGEPFPERRARPGDYRIRFRHIVRNQYVSRLTTARLPDICVSPTLQPPLIPSSSSVLLSSGAPLPAPSFPSVQNPTPPRPRASSPGCGGNGPAAPRLRRACEAPAFASPRGCHPGPRCRHRR